MTERPSGKSHDELVASELTRVPSGRSLIEPPWLDELAGIFANDKGAWADIKRVLRHHKVLRDVEAPVRDRANQLSKKVRELAPSKSSEVRIKAVWKDAPVDDDAVVPLGWGIGRAGKAVYRERVDKNGEPVEPELVSYDPIVISRVIKQGGTGTYLLELAWRRGKTWEKGVYRREQILNARDIVKTGELGVPVSSINANELVAYLHAYEHENMTDMTVGYATSTMGWQGERDDPTAHGFMAGYTQIGANGKAFELRTLGAGDVAEAEAVRRHGDFDAWKAAMNTALERWPALKIMVYAALAAPLLPILGAPNAIVEWVGRTSTGKTRILQIAQSVWRSGKFVIPGWNNTLANFESKAHLHTDVPLLLDDTKSAVEAKGRTEVGKVIYQFVSGVGRGRDSRDGGQRAASTWRSILLSTGEEPSSSIARAEGAAARVLSCMGNPTGGDDEVTGEMLDDLAEHTLAQHYGHAGPHFVQWLYDHRDEWPKLRSLYDTVTKQIRSRFKTRAASRLSRVIALIDLAAQLAYVSGCLPGTPRGAVDDPEVYAYLVRALDQAAAAADLATQAYDTMIGYAQARPHQWIEWGCEPKGHAPANGWLGWHKDLGGGNGVYAWIPPQLKSMLEQHDYRADAVLTAWRDDKVLQAQTENDLTFRCRPGGPLESGRPKLVRVYYVRVLGEEPMADEDDAGWAH